MSTTTSPGSRLLLVLAFIAIYFIWGTTYLANRFGLDGMKPFVLSTLRYTAAGILLLLWCRIKKLSLPSWKDIKTLSISGILLFVGGAGIVVFGEQYINSGHTAVVIATEPLLFILMDRKNRSSYLSNPRTLTGIGLGFAGIFVFSYCTAPHAQAAGHPEDIVKGTLIVLLSTFFWVAGALYAKNHHPKGVSAMAGVAVQYIAAALVCGIIAIALGEWSSFNPRTVSTGAWAGLAFLVLMGSLVAFTAFNWLIRIKPPAIVSTHTYVNPIVAVLLGGIMAGEVLNGIQVLALFMVLTGVLLTNIKFNGSFAKSPTPFDKKLNLAQCEK